MNITYCQQVDPCTCSYILRLILSRLAIPYIISPFNNVLMHVVVYSCKMHNAVNNFKQLSLVHLKQLCIIAIHMFTLYYKSFEVEKVHSYCRSISNHKTSLKWISNNAPVQRHLTTQNYHVPMNVFRKL